MLKSVRENELNCIKTVSSSSSCEDGRPAKQGVQIIKFLIVQLPPFSRHLIPLRSKHSSQNLVLKQSQSIPFP
jgi:hypothetical protein